MVKDYPGKEMYDKPFATGGPPLRERFLQDGAKIDIDRFINSGQGEALINSYKLQIKYPIGRRFESVIHFRFHQKLTNSQEVQ